MTNGTRQFGEVAAKVWEEAQEHAKDIQRKAGHDRGMARFIASCTTFAQKARGTSRDVGHVFFAHLKSESSDHYYIQFRAPKQPKTAEEWMPILKKEFGAGGDMTPGGPGVGGTWLHVQHCEQLGL